MTIVSLLLAVGLSGAADTKVPAKPAAEAAKTKTDGAKGATAAKTAPVDINSAGEAELKAIPGIGDAYAAKIIAGRPYANKTQLKSRNILPPQVYEKVKDRLVAKQPKK
ncbi:helix-hairpin-helix domain-containing protein [Geobacter sp. FeAm09]|nr:helix-hairpin-helix domain-containing protein [Geobacter sp. FeAm09]